MLFVSRAEASAHGGRLAVRLGCADGTLKEHVSRLARLGATIVSDQPRGGLGLVGLGEVVLADPEGNEFAVQSSDREQELVAQALEEGSKVDLSRSYFEGRTQDPPPFRTTTITVVPDRLSGA
jgi:hypothetical protein